MKDKLKKLLLITLLFIPTLVLAETFEEEFPIYAAIGMEAFVSIHMSVFVLWPISCMIAPNNKKQLFIILFVIRAIILLYCDFFVTTSVALIDFFAVFIGAFILVPITAVITKRSPFGTEIPNVKLNSMKDIPQGVPQGVTQGSKTELRCARCYSLINMSDKFCPKCGYELKSSNIMIIDEDKKGL